MNVRVNDPIERGRVVLDECTRVDRKDESFGPWLRDLVKENRRGSWLGSGRKHEYWLVPISLMEDAISVLPCGRDHCYLGTTYQNSAVLAIAPDPSQFELAVRNATRAVSEVVLILALRASDRWVRWGQKRCPNCFSTDMHAFTYERADEPASHFCNGCNTIWPPRSA